MKPTILVVDDEQEERDAMTYLLRHHHYLVESAANGREALDHLFGGARLPGLVLLDLNMPVMDGWELLHHLAEDGACRRIPVVVVSGSTAAHDAIAAPASVTFVTKPVSPPALLRLISDLLQRSPSGDTR